MLILDRLKSQIETSKQLSDSDTFISLMKLGEFITKIVTLVTISALKENSQRIKYRFHHTVVSADGIGVWSQVLDNILGTAISVNLINEFNEEKNCLLKNQTKNEWGYAVITSLYECRKVITKQPYDINVKLKLKDWFKIFSELRNDQAHNRISLADYKFLIPHLENSLYQFIDNFILFKRPWQYNHFTSLGVLKIISINKIEEPEASTKIDFSNQLNEGIYVIFENKIPIYIKLLVSDIGLNDFFVPNGRFTDKKYELISYLSGSTLESNSNEFLIPLEELPKSETHGLAKLEYVDCVYTNLPKLDRKYIQREEIEAKLYEALIDSRKWRIVSLRGRGGIGKTSTALEVLGKLTSEERYNAIIWFSARDIDFDEFGGPTMVQPRVLTKDDIAKEYSYLVEHPNSQIKGFDYKDYFTKELQNNLFGKTLFVFDNFETVERPIEIFEWLENYIELPSKILITTRHREFSTDKPIEVEGMKFDEFERLVMVVSQELKIETLIKPKVINELFRISLGHPYVVKILLGEISNTKSTTNLNRVFENKEQILQALFERTYDSLNPLSQKAFQILCNWRSIILEIALEAIIVCNPLDPNAEEEILDFDIKDAVDELKRFSFIEILNPKDDFRFINVPLAASFFGLSKIKANPNRAQIQVYTKLLQEFGASQSIAIDDGIEPRIRFFFSTVKQKINIEEDLNVKYLRIIQFLCRRYNKAWLFLADIYEYKLNNIEKTKNCYIEYLRNEKSDEEKEAYWDRLANFYYQSGKIDYYYQTMIDKYDYKNCSLSKITDLAKGISLDIKDRRLERVGKNIRNEILKRLITLIEHNNEFPRISATQLGNLAWLYLHSSQFEAAKKVAKKGLAIDPNNLVCSDLFKKGYL